MHFIAMNLVCHRIGKYSTLLDLAKQFLDWLYQFILLPAVYENSDWSTSLPAFDVLCSSFSLFRQVCSVAFWF